MPRFLLGLRRLGMFLLLNGALGGVLGGALGVAGCKKKNSTDGGLLDDPPQSDPTSAQTTTAGTSKPDGPVGAWQLQCLPTEDPKDSRTFTIDLTGVHSETDENQPIKISIVKSTRTLGAKDGTSQIIATMESGRGSIASAGNLFVGFTGGALTGQYQASTKKYEGLLTLVQDQDVSGLGVACEVLKHTP
jgi:hypothetical protein